MNRPKHWQYLPLPVLDTFLWDIANLKYDGYESSKAEKIHEIMNGNVYGNEAIVDEAWSDLPDTKLLAWASTCRETVRQQVEQLTQLIGDSTT